MSPAIQISVVPCWIIADFSSAIPILATGNFSKKVSQSPLLYFSKAEATAEFEALKASQKEGLCLMEWKIKVNEKWAGKPNVEVSPADFKVFNKSIQIPLMIRDIHYSDSYDGFLTEGETLINRDFEDQWDVIRFSFAADTLESLMESDVVAVQLHFPKWKELFAEDAFILQSLQEAWEEVYPGRELR